MLRPKTLLKTTLLLSKTMQDRLERALRRLGASYRWLTLAVVCTIGGLVGWYYMKQPKDIDNLCSIFKEKPGWYRQALAAEERWGVPIPVQMAIMRQESSFRYDAKPERLPFLGLRLPWKKSSSAYGYAQAIDATWELYVRNTGNTHAARDDFADAVDFIGWYASLTHDRLGIPKWDAYNQYLAYHEGHRGFRQQRHESKNWLPGVARKVEGYAVTYARQLSRCRTSLESAGASF